MPTITFVDEGQDFLHWDINQNGIVIACRPFQGWLWRGTRILNKDIKPGDLLHIQRGDVKSTVRYPVASIEG